MGIAIAGQCRRAHPEKTFEIPPLWFFVGPVGRESLPQALRASLFEIQKSIKAWVYPNSSLTWGIFLVVILSNYITSTYVHYRYPFFAPVSSEEVEFFAETFGGLRLLTDLKNKNPPSETVFICSAVGLVK